MFGKIDYHIILFNIEIIKIHQVLFVILRDIDRSSIENDCCQALARSFQNMLIFFLPETQMLNM